MAVLFAKEKFAGQAAEKLEAAEDVPSNEVINGTEKTAKSANRTVKATDSNDEVAEANAKAADGNAVATEANAKATDGTVKAADGNSQRKKRRQILQHCWNTR